MQPHRTTSPYRKIRRCCIDQLNSHPKSGHRADGLDNRLYSVRLIDTAQICYTYSAVCSSAPPPRGRTPRCGDCVQLVSKCRPPRRLDAAAAELQIFPHHTRGVAERCGGCSRTPARARVRQAARRVQRTRVRELQWGAPCCLTPECYVQWSCATTEPLKKALCWRVQRARRINASLQARLNATAPYARSPNQRTAAMVHATYRLALWRTYGMWAEATVAIQKFGTRVKASSRFSAQSPYVSIANRQTENMMRIASEFGFSPESRSRISTPSEDERDLFSVEHPGGEG